MWARSILSVLGYLAWCFCGYEIYLFVYTILKHERPKHAKIWMHWVAAWMKLKDKGAARIDRVWVIGVVLLTMVVLVYASTKQREINFECPQFCLGVSQVETPHAIRTVTLYNGNVREWRFCPGNGVNLYKGYVIELHATWTGWCYDLSGTRYYHIVTGRDINSPKYALVKAVSRPDCDPRAGFLCNSDSRPALANNCHDTPDDSDVVCDGDPQFIKETLNAESR